MKIEIYPYKHGIWRTPQWGWSMYAGNGEIMCVNIGFNTSEIARASIKHIDATFRKREVAVNVVDKRRGKK